MSLPHLLFLWLHVVAAITWIGGMIFLSGVLAPLMRQRPTVLEWGVLFRAAARRFRMAVWGTIGILVATGPVLLHYRGIAVTEPTLWPTVLSVKLSLVGALLLLTVSHNLLNSEISRITRIAAVLRTAWQQTLCRVGLWLPRLALLIALLIIAAALVLTRG